MNGPVFSLAATIAVQVLISMAAVTVPMWAPVAAGEVGVSAGYVGLFVSLVYGGSALASPMSGGRSRRSARCGRASSTCWVMLSVAQGAGIVGRIVWGAVTGRWLAPVTLPILLALAMAACARLTAAFSPQWSLAAIAAVSAVFFTYFGVFPRPSVFSMLVEHGAGYGQAFLLLAAPVLAIGARLLWLARRAGW